MKAKSKKIISLLATLFCATTILCQPFAYVSAAEGDDASVKVNGWEAVRSPDSDIDMIDQVKLVSLGEDITEITTAQVKNGAAVNRHTLKHIRRGKYSIDFDLTEDNIALWRAIYLSISWDCYAEAGSPDASFVNNGMIIVLNKRDPNEWDPTGWRVSLHNAEKMYWDENNNRVYPEFTTGGWQNIDLNQKLHIVIESTEGVDDSGNAVLNTTVYINGKPYGTTQYAADSYFYKDQSGNPAEDSWNYPTIAIGAGLQGIHDYDSGKFTAIIDTHSPDSTEALQALIDECDAAHSYASPEDEAAFRNAVTKAKADYNGAEPVVLAAIDELTAAKTAYDVNEPCKTGDLDFDREVSGSDLIVLRKQLLGITVADKVHSDINGDNIVDLLDLIHLKKVIAGAIAG